MRYRITRIAPLQAGKITAVHVFAIVFVGVLIFAGYIFLISSIQISTPSAPLTAMHSDPRWHSKSLNPQLSFDPLYSQSALNPRLLLIFLFPVFYGLIGFIVGGCSALFYTFMSDFYVVMSLELELTAQNKDTPP